MISLLIALTGRIPENKLPDYRNWLVSRGWHYSNLVWRHGLDDLIHSFLAACYAQADLEARTKLQGLGWLVLDRVAYPPSKWTTNRDGSVVTDDRFRTKFKLAVCMVQGEWVNVSGFHG